MVVLLLLIPALLHAEMLTAIWVDNANNECGFRIERRCDNQSDWTLIVILDPNTRTYSDRGLAAGQRCCYRVQAFNQAGDSSFTADTPQSCNVATRPDTVDQPPLPAAPPSPVLAPCFVTTYTTQ